MEEIIREEKPMTPLKHWMKLATTAEQQQLAEDAGTSRAYLYQLSNSVRIASADIAAAIEKAAKKLYKQSKYRLPALKRDDIAEICRSCPYALKCRGRL